jgi:NADPH-dependent 2,4-dienoyl-CoA reductase/sulfur reductase-like enzyme
MNKRVLIVGGVAGGASCAARLRRLDESAEIVVFDRGPHASFANCGLPYFVGDVITEERRLLVATGDLFRERFNIVVRTRHEVAGIDRARRVITVRDLAAGTEREERYDALVLSPGAAPIRPAMPGIDLPGIFAVRTIPDSVKIRTWIEERRPRKALYHKRDALVAELKRQGTAAQAVRAKKVEAALKRRGLNPVADNEGTDFQSFHVKDPSGLDLQISNGTKESRTVR